MSDSCLFKILYYLLDKEHVMAPELAAEFEVSPGTIYCDMEALSSIGIPIYAESGRNGGIYLLQDFILDRAILSEKQKAGSIDSNTKYICHRLYWRKRNDNKVINIF